MAGNVQKTIDIIFNGTDNISDVLSDIGSKLDNTGQGMQAIATPFAAVTKGIIAADAALAALAAGGIAFAFNASKDFESALVELEKVMGGGLNLERAAETAIALSETYGESATSILDSVAGFKQAGYDIDDSLRLTKDAMDLVIAGGVGTAQASSLIIASLKGFGKGADDARRYLDILNEVSNNYATSVEQLAVGMSKISPIANQMGFSMEDTAGLLVPVIEIFQSGDEAAVALKTGLLKLIDDSKPVTDALASIGVAQKDANGQLRDGKDIYLDVATAFQTIDEKQKLFLTSQLVGLEQSARMVTVFDNLALSTEITAAALKSTGSAAAEVAKQLATSEKSIEKFRVSITNLFKSTGDQFKIAIQSSIDGGAELTQTLRDMVEDGAFEPIFAKVRELATDLGDLLSGVAKNLPAAFKGVEFEDLIKSFENVADSLGLLFENVDLSTPEGLESIIQDVIDTLTSLGNVSAGLIDEFKPFIARLSEMGDAITDIDGDTIEFIGNVLALGTAFGILGGFVVAGGAFVSGLGTLAGLFSSGGVLATGLAAVAGLITGPVGLIAAFAGATAAIYNFADNKLQAEANQQIEAIKKEAAAVKDLTDQINSLPVEAATIDIFTAIETGDLEAAQDLIDEIVTTEYVANIGTEADEENLNKYLDNLANIPEEKQTELLALINSGSEDDVEQFFTELDGHKDTTVKISAEADQESIKKATEKIKYEVDGVEYTMLVPIESNGIEKVKADIETLPTEKQIEITLQGDIDTKIASIKATAQTAEAAFKYKAEVDITEAQEATKQLEAAYNSINVAIQSSADVYNAAFGGAESDSYQARNEALDILKQEQDLREQTFELQKQLTESQIKYTEAKTNSMNSGDAVIQIDAAGLEPALEMIFWEIVKKTQIRANEVAADMLLT